MTSRDKFTMQYKGRTVSVRQPGLREDVWDFSYIRAGVISFSPGCYKTKEEAVEAAKAMIEEETK